MTRDDATREAERLNREHPDRVTHHWLVRPAEDGDWSIVRVAHPPGARIDPLTTTTEARPKPPQADDPRPNYWRDAGGPWVG